MPIVSTDHDGIIRIRESFIIFPSVLFPWEMSSGAVINTFPVIAGFFARMAVGLIFYYSVFLMAVSVSGNRIIAVLLCGALPLIPAGIFLLADFIATAYLFGYDSNQSSVRGAMALAYTNPVMWESAINGHARLGRLFGVFRFPQVAPVLSRLYVSYIGVIAALVSISYACSHKRRLERTGDSVVFTAFKNVCVFLVAMVGMMGMGGILMSSTRSRGGLYIGFVLGFAIFYLIAQMIAEKSFNIKYKIKSLLPYSAVMAAMYIVMLLITHFGMSFYVNHVPQASEVAGVSLHHQWRWSGASHWSGNYADNPEVIVDALAVHQRILDNRRYLRNVHWRTVTSADWADTFGFPITYRMQDGTSISRQYRLPREFMAAMGIADLMSSPVIVMSQYPAINRPEVIELIRLHYWSDQDYERISWDNLIIDKNEIASLLEAVTKDLVIQNAEQWYAIAGGEILWPDERSRREIGIGIQVYDEFIDHYRAWHISLSGRNMENTLEWMEEQGFFD